jgi:hypothetical protein
METSGENIRSAYIASDDMVASTSSASTATRCADVMKRWKVTTGSQTAIQTVMMEIGEDFEFLWDGVPSFLVLQEAFLSKSLEVTILVFGFKFVSDSYE